jgi:hypothetical protein
LWGSALRVGAAICEQVHSPCVRQLTVLPAPAGLLSRHHPTGATTVIAEAPAPTAVQQSAAASRSDVPAPLSLKRIAATLQVVLATRRAARSEEHAYWYTIARGM